MRRFLATLMALIMLMSVIPVSAETAKSGKLVNETYTQPISKVEKLVAGYAILLQDAEICSDQQLKKPIGDAEKGDVVYAESRKGYGTANDRVKITWACDGEAVTGWASAKALRLMDKSEVKAYEKKAQKNKQAVKDHGKFLLNIDAYEEPAQAPGRDTLPATSITSLKTTSKGMNIAWKAIDGATKYQVFRSTKKASGFKRIATVTTTSYVDAAAKRNNAYYYYIKAVNAEGAGAKSATKGRYHDFGPAAKFKRADNGTVTISWAAKKNAVSYAVYRANEGSSSYKKIATVKTGTSYVDKSAANGKTYSYFIQANYTVNGVTVTGSQGGRKSYTYGVVAPVDQATTNVAAGVKLTWSAVENATGYRVFYREDKADAWTLLTTAKATATSFTHRAPAYGKKIYYSVRTQGKHNGKTVYAPHCTIETVALARPTAFVDGSIDGEVTVSWTEVAHAESYKIILNHDENGRTYECEVDAENGCTLTIQVDDGGSYTATVQARKVLDSVMWYSAASAPVSTHTDYLDPSTIPVMTAQLSSTANMLNVAWNKVDNAIGYMIVVNGEGWTQQVSASSEVTQVSIPVNEGDITVGMSATLDNGKERFSNSVEMTADWADGICLTVPNVTATQSEKYNQAQLTWDPVADADTYQIMVLQGEWGEFPGPDGTTCTVPLNGNGTYEVLVRAEAWLDNGETVVGPWYEANHTFTWTQAAMNTPVAKVELSDTPNVIALSWAAIPGAEGYGVQVYGENQGWLLEEETTQTSLSIPVNGGEALTIYVWSVIDGQKSDSHKLTIEAQWPGMVAMTRPNVTYTLLSKPQVRVEWNTVPGASSYYLLVTAAGEGAGAYEVYGNSYTLTVTPEVAYQFNVVPVHYDDTVEYPGPRSAFVDCYPVWDDSFKLATPVVTADVTTPNVINFTWNAVENAEYYDVVISSFEKGSTKLTLEGTQHMLLVNGDGIEYTITVHAVGNHPVDGYEVYSDAGTAVATATWENGVNLVEPVLEVYANSCSDEMNLVETYVSWESVEGAAGYNMYYGKQGAAMELLSVEDSTGVGFDLEKGETYTFVVTPYFFVDGVTVYGPDSEELVFTALYGVDTLTAPEVTLALDAEGYIVVTWKAVENAFSYIITYGKVGETPAAQYVEAFTGEDWDIPVTSWRFPAEIGATYEVTMCANWEEDGSIEHGPASAVQTIVAEEEEVTLVAPVMTVSTAERGYVTLTWDAVPGATKYRIFYRPSTASGFSNMYVDGAETSVKIPVANNTSIRVYMRAIHVYLSGESVSGPTCATQNVSVAWTARLAAPTLTVAKGVKGELNLSWTEVAGAAGYILSYKTASETVYNDIALTADTLSYVLPVTPETTYNLYVYAYEGDETLPYAGKLSATQTFFATWIPVLDAPVMTVEQGVYFQLRINWEPVELATRYRIFYKESTASGFSNVIVDGDQTSCVLDVENDKTYIVYMRGINVDTDGTTTSGPTCAKQTVAVHWDEPDVPTPALTVTPVAGDASTTTMEIAWTVPDEECGYVLYYREVDEETYQAVDVTDFNSEVIKSGPALEQFSTGSQWEFYMQAYFMAGEKQFWGEPTEVITITAAYGYYALTAPVVELSLSETENTLLVAWESQPFATHYKVYHKASTDELYYCTMIAGDETSLEIPATADTTYNVYVTACFEENNVLQEGPACQVKDIYAYWAPVLAKPVLTLANDFNGKVTVSWGTLTGATSVEVYYRKTTDEGFTVVEVPATNTEHMLLLEAGASYQIYAVSYHEHLGVVYAFRASDTKTVTTLGQPTLAAPVMTLKLGDKYYLNISWTKVQNATGYSIFYKTSAQTGYTNVKVDADVTNYLFAVEEGETYSVYMRAIHVDDIAGVNTSGTKCATKSITALWQQYRALLIGQTYPNTSSELPGPDVDARSMRSMLNTMTGTPYQVTVKYNLTATGILSAISTAFAGADEDSVSLFYYSGHGAQSYGNEYHGALCGIGNTYVTVDQLRAALDQIPGKKIVLLDSCHSGEHIGKSANGVYVVTKADLASFNSKVISAFASKSKANLAADEYYVITASRSTETSQSVSYNGDDYVGLFTYALLQGSGFDELDNAQISGLYSDNNGDKQISLAEAYSYAYELALDINPEQNAQVYPVNSSFVLWGR